jgi:hypothetical protein
VGRRVNNGAKEPASEVGEAGPRAVAWLVTAPRIDIASIRYRAIYPAAGLEKSGWSSILVSRPEDLKPHFADLAALVIVKRLDVGILPAVSQANDLGIPVILDLCDDILQIDYRSDQHELFRMVFDAIAPRLAKLVVTGHVLRRRFIQYGFPEEKIHVIPDCIENEGVTALAKRFMARVAPDNIGVEPAPPATQAFDPAAPTPVHKKSIVHRILSAIRRPRRSALSLRRTYRFIRYGEPPVVSSGSAPPEKVAAKSNLESALEIKGRMVIWFGNHGGPHSDFGMLTLLRVAKALKSAHAQAPFTLVVVSDHYDKWKTFVQPLGIPSVYVSWTQDGCQQLLEKAWVFVMPVGEDEFSQSKSANRVLLATELGIPTVSQPLDSLGPLAGQVAAEDFQKKLVYCLTNRSKAREQVMHERVAAHAVFGLPVIVREWIEVLTNAKAYAKARDRYGVSSTPQKLLVMINLVQDAALALPIIDEARRRGLETGVVVSHEAMNNNPRLLGYLAEREIAPTYLTQSDFRSRDFRWLRGATALLCPTDTNAGPHRQSHRMTQMAKGAGVRTYTLQHGLENAGLTVRDPEFPNVQIASDTIFTWNAPDLLPEWLDMPVRLRCVGVGRVAFKGAPADRADVEARLKLSANTVAVFENLHWQRYDEAYRKGFVERVAALADAIPEHTVLVVPHPAGRWSVKNANGLLRPNVRILNPADKRLADIDLATVLSLTKAVITTPSTIAVDAAEEGLPVAIISHGIGEQATYAPIAHLETATDWIAFVERSLRSGRERDVDQFLDRIRMKGDAAAAIIDHIFPASSAQAGRQVSNDGPIDLKGWKQAR